MPPNNPPDRRLTAPHPDAGPRPAPARGRCRLAVGSGPGFTNEMACLLRTRLRVAILIMLGLFAFHFLRHLFWVGPTSAHRMSWVRISAVEIAVMAGASVLLWSSRPLSMRSLRALEGVIFGLIAAFFAWLQVGTYHDPALLEAIVPGHEALVFRLVALGSALRWFLLIVLYGTFIPNTGRRCAVVVVSLALLPVALMGAGSLLDRAAAPTVLSALPDTVILMAAAVAVAVFGCHKIHELHEMAHEARRIGQYRLTRVLGFGGMGTVYLAEHVLLRRPCAVKLIRADQAGDPRTLQRFEREVQAAATLTHLNTIEIFDYGRAEDGTFYYVMEYLPGMNLQELVERYGALPPGRAVHLLRQVCQALREAHGIGLIHRDIKPSNIFACERGKVYDVAKLLDFGLVKSFGAAGEAMKLTAVGAVTGSPAFMSPEQALERKQLDARTDIYNVGAVAYFLTTGALPFDRISTVEMLHAHAFEPVVPTRAFTETVPIDLQRVILRCLEKDPDHRYPDAPALDRALAACAIPTAWTPEAAEEWWQRHEGGTGSPSFPEAVEHEAHTVHPGTGRSE